MITKFRNMLIYSFYVLAYAVVLSLAAECFLNLLGIYLAISLDGKSVIDEYPRYIPFCIIIGVISVIAFLFVLWLNIRKAHKHEYSKKVWMWQFVISIILSLPFVKLWAIFFKYLQQVF